MIQLIGGKFAKGSVTGVTYKKDYDFTGTECRAYRFRMDGENITASAPKDCYLSDGDVLVLELIKRGETYEALCGLNTASNYTWGNNSSALKKYKKGDDAFVFVTGKIVQKQKHSSTDLSASASNTQASDTMVTYNIVLDNGSFYVSEYIGKKLNPGENIDAVTSGGTGLLVYNTTTGKKYGVKFPYYIIFIIFGILFSAWMYYLMKTGSTLVVSPVSCLIVINCSLVFFGALNLASLMVSRSAQKFMKSKTGK